MKKYRLINSVLGGIYGVQVGYSDDQALLELKKDLNNQIFRNSIEYELEEAFSDDNISWAEMLNDNEVGYFEDEAEAREFVKEMVWDVVFEN